MPSFSNAVTGDLQINLVRSCKRTSRNIPGVLVGIITYRGENVLAMGSGGIIKDMEWQASTANYPGGTWLN
jgi:hypothetical protein